MDASVTPEIVLEAHRTICSISPDLCLASEVEPYHNHGHACKVIAYKILHERNALQIDNDRLTNSFIKRCTDNDKLRAERDTYKKLLDKILSPTQDLIIELAKELINEDDPSFGAVWPWPDGDEPWMAEAKSEATRFARVVLKCIKQILQPKKGG